MDSTLWILCGTAILIAFIHTVMGPDHYLPFVMLGRANKWSAKKVAAITALAIWCLPRCSRHILSGKGSQILSWRY